MDPATLLRKRVLAQVQADPMGGSSSPPSPFAEPRDGTDPDPIGPSPTSPPVTGGPVETAPLPPDEKPGSPPILPIQAVPEVSPPVPGPSAVAPRVSPAPTTMANIPGFDLGKLNNSAHVNAKYTPAVRTFAEAIGTLGLPPGSASLPKIVEYAQRRGFPDAKVVGSDTIDFGDGYGPIDVITNVGGADQNWWFNNLGPNGVPNSQGANTATSPPAGPAGQRLSAPGSDTGGYDALTFGGSGGALLDPDQFGQSSLLRQLLAQRLGGQ